MTRNKTLFFNDLINKVRVLKEKEKTVVQSHGIFDLIHPGIIQHLKEAKSQGDILIVTVVKDKDVRRGPGRPIFTEDQRAENVASLEMVDYVCLVDDEIPFECVKRIKPDVFAKGRAQKERDQKIHAKIFQEEREIYFGKSQIYETGGFSFSSSYIINNLLDMYSEETKSYLQKFATKYNFSDIAHTLDKLKDLNILIIGDGIIDEYHYCETMGKSPKSQLIVNKYLTHEIFAGGAFAIANHVAGICEDVELITLLGHDKSREEFVLNNLKTNIRTKFFYADDRSTIVKKRYINQYQKQKLFEINHIDDSFIADPCESEIIDYLKTKVEEADLILVCDFGHGLITNKIIRMIEKSSKKLAVNSQTNGANEGYNLITKYRHTRYICLDVPEARLATQDKYGDIEEVGQKLLQNIQTDYLMITLGSDGSICFTGTGEINRTPAFSTKVIDIIGAGDAFFAYTAPCAARGIHHDLISFIGNAIGALAVQIVGNKRPVEKYELLEFIHAILK